MSAFGLRAMTGLSTFCKEKSRRVGPVGQVGLIGRVGLAGSSVAERVEQMKSRTGEEGFQISNLRKGLRLLCRTRIFLQEYRMVFQVLNDEEII